MLEKRLEMDRKSTTMETFSSATIVCERRLFESMLLHQEQPKAFRSHILVRSAVFQEQGLRRILEESHEK